MVFWLSLNCQNYLSYCSKNGHKWTFFPKISFLANVLPTKINQNTTKSLKNLGTILLTQARYCSLAMMKKQKTYVNWDSAAILQLFLSYVWTILQPFCSYFAAILQLFCSYFAAILWLFWSYFAEFCSYFEAICQGFDLDLPCFFCFPRVFTRFEWEQAGFPQGFHWEVCGFGKSRKTIANRMASNSMIFIFFLYHELRFQGRLGLPPTIGAGKN